MINYNKTLIEFCNNNNFTDSETDSSDEESSKIIQEQPQNNRENNMDSISNDLNDDAANMNRGRGTQIKVNFYDEQLEIIQKQNKNKDLTEDKITIIDSNRNEPSSIINNNLYYEIGWETIELSDLDDIIFDVSNNENVAKLNYTK